MTVGRSESSHSATINGQGRLVVPIEIRSALGLEPGDRVEFIVGADGVRLATAQMLATSVWANNHGADAGDSTVDVRTARTRDQVDAAAKHARTQGNAADTDKDVTAADLLAALGLA